MVLTGVAACQPKVIIDLAGLEFIDSSGVAARGHCCIKRSRDHLAGKFIVCRTPVTARQAVRPLLRLCADRSVNADRKNYGLMIT